MDISAFLLEYVYTYGAPIFALIVMLAAAGLPLPTSLLVVAAGALVRQGMLDFGTTFALGLLGLFLGDSISFAIGRWGSERMKNRLQKSRNWVRAQILFEKHGVRAVFITRWLLSGLGTAVNLLAGGSGMRYSPFATSVFGGQVLWLLMYGGIGFTFSSQWRTIADVVISASSIISIVAGVVAVLVFFLRKQGKVALSTLLKL